MSTDLTCELNCPHGNHDTVDVTSMLAINVCSVCVCVYLCVCVCVCVCVMCVSARDKGP